MTRSGLVPLLILAYPILEIVVFIQVGGAIGVLSTLLLILGGIVIGVALVRATGLRLLQGLRNDLAAGGRPEQRIVGGAMTALAGVLLIMPGFISDVVGLALLLPPVQRFVAGRIAAGITVVGGGTVATSTQPQPGGGVVDLAPEDFERRPDEGSPWRSDGTPPVIDGR
jgi:UPF0716 protein FxsA